MVKNKHALQSEMTDAEKLKEIRLQLRLSQQELADLSRVSQSAISSIEVGRNPMYWELFTNLVNYAHVNPYYLIRDEAPVFLNGKTEVDALKKKVQQYEKIIDKLIEVKTK